MNRGQTNPGDFSSDRNSSLAIRALTLSVFTGTQILSRLSVGSLDIAEIIFGFVSFIVLASMLVTSQNIAISPLVGLGAGSSRLAAFLTRAPRARKWVLLFASIALALIPRLEASGFKAFGMSSRLLLGAAVTAVVGEHANRWLLGVSVLTIVLHPWNHPNTVTLIFVGLIMLGIALSTRAESESSTSRIPETSGSGLPSYPFGGHRSTATVIGAIALSLLTATLLRGQARQLAWSPNGTNRTGDSIGSAGDKNTPRERFRALSADSQLDLAYRPTRSTQEVMTLFTTQATPAFLRAQTFDRWTGKTWKASESTTNEDLVQSGIWLVRPSYRDQLSAFMQQRRGRNPANEPTLGPDGVRQMVIQTKVIFNGYTPVPIEPVAMAADSDRPTSQWRSDGTITSDGAGPSVYVVVNVPSAVTGIDLSRTDLLGATHISTRTKALAAQIVRGLATPEAKARAISAWVTTNIQYDLSVDRPAAGTDPIDELLFRSKAGSCTHFATATAALLRSVGVPARIATGFVGQTQIAPNQISVLAKDAHAWAEIPLIGGGWAVNDTTLGATEVGPSRETIPARTILSILALTGFAIAVLVIYRRRRAGQKVSADARIWDDLISIGRLLDRHPTEPLSYCRFSESLDRELDMSGTLARVGADLDRRTFGPPQLPDPGLADDRVEAVQRVLVAARASAKAVRKRTSTTLREQRRAGRRAGRRRYRRREVGLPRRTPDDEPPEISGPTDQVTGQSSGIKG